jgi:hypothetical protein
MQISAARRFFGPAHKPDGMRECGDSSLFTGRVNWVQIDLGDDAEDADHLITPEERLKVVMARQ